MKEVIWLVIKVLSSEEIISTYYTSEKTKEKMCKDEKIIKELEVEASEEEMKALKNNDIDIEQWIYDLKPNRVCNECHSDNYTVDDDEDYEDETFDLFAFNCANCDAYGGGYMIKEECENENTYISKEMNNA